MTLENFPYWTSTMGQTDSVGVTRLRNSGDGHNQVDHTCMAASDSSKLEYGISSGRNKLSPSISMPEAADPPSLQMYRKSICLSPLPHDFGQNENITRF